MTADDAFRERNRLAGQISQYLFEEWCSSIGDFRFGGQKYRVAYDEDYEELGYGDDPDNPLLIRRESDGTWFEVELEANVHPVLPKAAS